MVAERQVMAENKAEFVHATCKLINCWGIPIPSKDRVLMITEVTNFLKILATIIYLKKTLTIVSNPNFLFNNLKRLFEFDSLKRWYLNFLRNSKHDINKDKKSQTFP